MCQDKGSGLPEHMAGQQVCFKNICIDSGSFESFRGFFSYQEKRLFGGDHDGREVGTVSAAAACTSAADSSGAGAASLSKAL